jgi:hypothetical protein
MIDKIDGVKANQKILDYARVYKKDSFDKYRLARKCRNTMKFSVDFSRYID